MNAKYISIFLILLTILFVSCEADIDLQNISNEVLLHPSLVVPLGGANVDLGEILQNNNVDGRFVIGDKEIYYLSYDSAEFKFRNIDLLKNSQQLSKTIFPSPISEEFFPQNTIIPTITSYDSLNLGVNSSLNTERIDSVKIKSATLSIQINVTSDLASINPSDLKITLLFPNGKIRKLDGTSNSISFIPTAFGQSSDVIISNFMLNTSARAAGVPFQINIDSKTGTLPVTVGTSSKITCIMKFSQLNYAVAYGYFEPAIIGTQTLQQKMNLSKNLPNGMFKFTNPQVDITAVSNIGTYLLFKVDYVKAFLSTDQAITPFYAWFSEHTTNSTTEVFENKPAIPGLWVIKKMKSLNKDWGETNQLFVNANKPDVLEYKFSASIDKLSTQSDISPNFITPDAAIKVYTKTTIPLQLSSGSYYEFNDSIGNVFDPISKAFDKINVDNIDSTFLVLNIKNGLPIKTLLSIKFLDSFGNELQTNFQKSYIILAGTVDGDGIVQPGQKRQTVTISFAKEQVDIIRKAQKIAYSVRIEGENVNSNIHFTKFDTFDLKVGLFFQTSLKAN